MTKAKKERSRKLDTEEKISAIYFDGKRNNMLKSIVDSRGQPHRRIVEENNITVTVLPEGNYLDHLTPEEPVRSQL